MSDIDDELNAGIGHNSQATLDKSGQEKLREIVARIERLEKEKDGIAADIKDVYAEAKAKGYDVKVLRKVVSDRKKDRKDRAEFESVYELYMAVFE